MKPELSDQYMRHLQRFSELQKKGNLISLLEVYEDYGKPKFYSPRRRFQGRQLRNLTGYILKYNNYEIEKVIQYRGQDIYACSDLAIAYLNNLDIKNYMILNMILREHGALDYFLSLI